MLIYVYLRPKIVKSLFNPQWNPISQYCDSTYPGKHLVVEQFDGGEKGVTSHELVIVVRLWPGPDPTQHVRTNGRVVHVSTHGAAGQIFEDREREGVSHGVDENIWGVFQSRLHSQHHWAQALAQHRKVRISFGHHPATSPEENKIHILLRDFHVESVLSLLQDFPRICVDVARVHDDL